MTSVNGNSADQFTPARTLMPDPKWAALAVALIATVVLLSLDGSERERTLKNERLHVTERLSATRARLEAAIHIPVSATRALALIYAAHLDFPEHEFFSLAAQAKVASPGIIDIALFRDTVISCVYPRDGNEKLVGMDFRNVPAQWPTYQRMMATRQPVIAGPLKLLERDGSEAVVVRIPAYRMETGSGKEYFIGAIGAPFLFDQLLQEAGLPDIEEHLHVAIRGRDGKGSGGEVFYGDPNVFAMNPVVQKVTLPGGEWEIAAYPRGGWGAASSATNLLRLLGVAIGLLATFTAYEIFRHLRVRAENEQRLMESEAQLKLRDSALNTAANAIVITDREARITWVNQAFSRLTGYEFEEAIGHHCGELVKSGIHDRKFYEAMWKTILSGQVWRGELVNRRKDGTLYHDEMTIAPVFGKDGEISHFVSVKQDVSARKIGEEQMRNLAFYDHLTELPNRRLLLDRLGQALASGKRSDRYGALMFLDLDNFKPLNDAHGHDVGDLLLIEAARRIVGCVREEDTVARFGGDEFVVMLKEIDADRPVSATRANGVAEKIRAALAVPYRLELLQAEHGETMITHRCTASIGVVLFIGHECNEEDLLRYADIAMYRAKTAGGDAVHFHSGQS